MKEPARVPASQFPCRGPLYHGGEFWFWACLESGELSRAVGTKAPSIPLLKREGAIAWEAEIAAVSDISRRSLEWNSVACRCEKRCSDLFGDLLLNSVAPATFSVGRAQMRHQQIAGQAQTTKEDLPHVQSFAFSCCLCFSHCLFTHQPCR